MLNESSNGKPLMKESIKTGISFGLASGVITTLGLMTGLNAGTKSELAVIGGILVIAIADALSDSVGIHISEESENVHTEREIWAATISTFFSKLITALTFVIPVLLLPLPVAMIVSVIWGLCLVSVLSFWIARLAGVAAWKVIVEHLVITVAVVVISHLVGLWVAAVFA